MAERAPPPLDETRILDSTSLNGDGNDDGAAISPPPIPETESTDEEKLFSRPAATYVVQVPKDQIYRVPPPENAAIAERRHKPKCDGSRRRSRLRPCASRCCFVVLVLAFLAVSLVIALTFVPAFISPREPLFHIERVDVVDGARAYRVALRSENPNARTDMSYAQGGVVSLRLRGKEIAAGKFPAFYHAHGSSAAFETVLRERGALPNGTRSRMGLTLRMSDLSARTEVWTWSTGIVKFGVTCDLTVDSLAVKDGARVLSQSCRIT